MFQKHVFEPGTVLSNHTIVGPGKPTAGHSCWAATCNFCQAPRNVRGTLLNKGTARCPCQTVRKPRTTAPAGAQNLVDDLAYANGRIDTLSDALDAALARIAKLEQPFTATPIDITLPATSPSPASPTPPDAPLSLRQQFSPRALGYKAKVESDRRAAHAANMAAMAALLASGTGKSEYLLRYEAEFDDILFEVDNATRARRKKALGDLNAGFNSKEMT